MATTNKTRKRAEKTWHANISTVVNGVAALKLTSTSPSGKVEVFGYYVSGIPAAWGVAFHLEKFAADVQEGEPACYAVNIGPEPSCECKGWLRWGHRTLCKHIRSLRQLHGQGRLPTGPVLPLPKPQPKPAPQPRPRPAA
jgi:hypothetical protein